MERNGPFDSYHDDDIGVISSKSDVGYRVESYET
jgi:hypothetical protein